MLRKLYIEDVGLRNIEQKIMEFFESYIYFDTITDEDVTRFAKDLHYDPIEVKNAIYKFVFTFLVGGESIVDGEFVNETTVDSKELAKGIEIELEHVNNDSLFAFIIAKKIALDHLKETQNYKNSKYYEMLEFMKNLMKQGITVQNLKESLDMIKS